MSVAETAPVAEAVPVAQTAPSGVVSPPLLSTRFFRSELWLIFGRRRNWVGLAVLAVVPIIIAIAVKVTEPPAGGGGDVGNFLGSITSNGLFVALSALTLELPLFLPIAVASIAGDAIAGEANLGTLRYLLAVPVDRTRLLLVKFGAIVTFALVCTLLVAAVGALLGLALFGGGPVLTLSGSMLPFWVGVGRLMLVCLYLTVCLTGFAAIGMFVSTLTEQPIAATIAAMLLYFSSQIMDAIPQLHAIQRFLPTHYWLSFAELMRDPVDFGRLAPGLLSALAYLAIFGSAAWARFSGRDVTS
jgi:ABC-2 type transport system permease protein